MPPSSNSRNGYSPLPLQDQQDPHPQHHRHSSSSPEPETGRFLNQTHGEEKDDPEILDTNVRYSRRRHRTCSLCVSLYTIFLLLWTVVLGWIHLHTSFKTLPSSKNDKSKPLVYSPATSIFTTPTVIKFDENFSGPTPFEAHRNYTGPGTPALDNVWDELTSLVYVTLSPTEASRLHTPTMTIPWNGTLDVPVVGIDVFHQLHCLDMIRRALQPDVYGRQDKGNSEKGEWHIHHCVNSLRQSLMCGADVSPISFRRVRISEEEGGGGGYKNVPDFGVVHECRDFGKLVDWAKERMVPESEFE